MTYPDLNSRPAPDRFIRRWLVITGCIAALMLLWQFLPAIEAWFSPREAAERTVTPRGDLAADEQTTIQLFEKSRGSVVYITTAQLVRDVWSRNVFSVPRGTGSGFERGIGPSRAATAQNATDFGQPLRNAGHQVQYMGRRFPPADTCVIKAHFFSITSLR